MTRSRSAALITILAVAVSACGGSSQSPGGSGGGGGGAVEITWFCCLGGGDGEDQVAVEKKVVDEFNASHTDIHLTFARTPYEGAFDAFATQIASPNPPDIVGPLGIGGGNAFPNQWLDLSNLIESNHYDMSQFPANTVDIYRTPGEGQVGIPFGFYPSVLWYKKSHFEEVGLKEPPHKWGDPYVMPDLTERPWDYDTVREIARMLTFDENGADANDPNFDPDNIVQWGFEPQRDDLRQTGAYFGAGRLVSDDGKTAQIPDAWRAAWHFFYDGIWTDHFAMTGPQFESPDFNPSDYPFFTGNVSMSQNYLWSSYGVGDAGDDWDIAAMPSYNGKITAAFNADTFRIFKGSKHPQEAFEVLQYLLDDAREELLGTYGAVPARPSEQQAFFDTLAGNFPQKVDWQVALDGIAYADVPNFESPMPAYNEAMDVVNRYGTDWQAKPGLDLDKEIDKMRQELQGVFDAANK
jgi:multiple sugar transport system substrate-binding protein